MFKGSVYRRCTCKAPMANEDGEPVLGTNGKPKLRELGSACPDLGKRDHGSWYYYVELPPGPRGKRRRPRKGGFLTKKKAEEAAQKIWDQAQDGVDVLSDETVEQFLLRWFSKRVDLKRSTRSTYEDHINRVFVPHLGHLKMRDLRTRHLQEMFEQIWRDNERHAANQDAADLAKAGCEAARRAWKQAARPRPPELRQRWNEAREKLRQARRKPRYITGPGVQLKMKNELSAALDYAKNTEKLISENWTEDLVLPKYTPPKPLVWTDERVAHWQETGDKPGPVMVWTAEQTGAFLDAVAEHRLYPMFHLMVFRGTRRGESCGLPWRETDMTAGTVHISEQLVAASYDVWEDTPKSDSGARTVRLDSQTHQLLLFWRRRQQTERAEWEEKHRKEPKKYDPYVDSGRVFTWEDGRPYHPEYLSQVFNRLVQKLGLPTIRLHDLRHCAATLSLAAGVHMKTIQVLLGHSSYKLTADTYTSVLPQLELEAADAPVALVPRKANQQEGEEGAADDGRPPGPQPVPQNRSAASGDAETAVEPSSHSGEQAPVRPLIRPVESGEAAA
ncbi:tyrosine-type recombinase/integrase [Streptomyces sp. MUM 2J]|uniref:tyrosine-type recombinase/integrase n=1 Tax=Streptomyces sp. MUM 2J TaxID=2791987 RepID=UPI001F03E46B|nr:tyrosine-type recombinase/integrase [Streptomyces sp. MUM 2J]MCH0562199.1 tyrosine-type recombinase/integrase [Streptomyces sp. MUM 2J]